MENFEVIQPGENLQPILISVPHCGSAFPAELLPMYQPHLTEFPDDTDWYVDRLYDFATEIGITVIKSVYCRWVIDLNRDLESKPLYSDGRIITELVPRTNFRGQQLYKDKTPDAKEIKRRVDAYYVPYHKKLQLLLNNLKSRFGKVLLWEAHSIRQSVPTIYPEKIPDLILGDADGGSASPTIIQTSMEYLQNGPFEVSHNHPFKGGYITRNYGDPKNSIHALQLEMTKINYMDDDELKYDEGRAERVRELLIKTFEGLLKILKSS